jgi:uncharacterized damage-inducible protein DinB
MSHANGAVFDRLLGHDEWATRRLLERCRGLTPAQFTQRFDMGPGSLHDTLTHVVSAMRRWADRIEGRPLRESLEKPAAPRPPAELVRYLDEAARDLRSVAARIDSAGTLDETFQVSFAGAPAPITLTRGTAIVHVATHGAHHRAQCLNMLRRLGVADPPDLDAVEWEIESRG